MPRTYLSAVIFLLCSFTANAALLSFGAYNCEQSWDYCSDSQSRSGLFSFTITGGAGGGYAVPILTASSDYFPYPPPGSRYQSYASEWISVGGFWWSSFGRMTTSSTDPARHNAEGKWFVPPQFLNQLIPFQFDQSVVVRFSYSLDASGYQVYSQVTLEGFLLFDAQGQQLTPWIASPPTPWPGQALVTGSLTYDSPEPSTLLLTMGGLIAALLGRRFTRKRAP